MDRELPGGNMNHRPNSGKRQIESEEGSHITNHAGWSSKMGMGGDKLTFKKDRCG